jgi:hypothetical protein
VAVAVGGVVAVVVVAAGGAFAAGAVAAAPVEAGPNAFTPPWPLQAPVRVAPLKDVPSLHVAVTGAAFWAKAGIASKTTVADESRNARTGDLRIGPYDDRA